MTIPDTLRYTVNHEWVRAEADGTLTVGITAFAQDNLGELVFVELPAVGREVAATEACAVVESVKAASDVYAPVAGEVIAKHDELTAAPNQINKDPYGAWLFKLRPKPGAEMSDLLDATAYAKIAAAP